jgi:hypothetical protein
VDPSGLVDLNLIPQKSFIDRYLHNTLDNFNPSNAFSIATHGYGGWFEGSDNMNELANRAKKSGKDEILLIACDQGEGEFGNMAQKLADLSGMRVQYSTGYVYAIPFFGIPFTIKPDNWYYADPRK